MVKKIALALLVGILALPLVPSEGMCWYGRPGYGYHHHGYYNGDPWLWGLSGLVVGTAITAAVLQPPPPPRVVYATAQPGVYSYPPSLPPGMCRWERYVLDGYGRTLSDRYGQPVKEYTVSPCQYAPN